jgi:hypothetical protein
MLWRNHRGFYSPEVLQMILQLRDSFFGDGDVALQIEDSGLSPIGILHRELIRNFAPSLRAPAPTRLRIGEIRMIEPSLTP